MEKIPDSKITIKELAKTIGVSISTVSNALNDTGWVKKDTKERILKIARAFNYKPNIIARGLKKKSINSIAVIVPDIANPVYSQFLNSIDLIAKEKEYKVLLANTHYLVKEENEYIESLRNLFVDGFIFISGHDNKELIESLYLRNEKFVLLERPINSTYSIPLVFVDKQNSFIEAIDYLYDLGHRKISFVSYSYENYTSIEDRYKGYCLGLKKHNLEYNDNLVILEKNLLGNELSISKDLIKSLLKNQTTAIVTASDFIAIGIIKILKNLKIRIPQDISVIGFDDILLSRILEPSLTTIKLPKKLMGKIAINLLIDLIENKDINNKIIKVPTNFIIRESTGQIKTI